MTREVDLVVFTSKDVVDSNHKKSLYQEEIDGTGTFFQTMPNCFSSTKC